MKGVVRIVGVAIRVASGVAVGVASSIIVGVAGGKL